MTDSAEKQDLSDLNLIYRSFWPLPIGSTGGTCCDKLQSLESMRISLAILYGVLTLITVSGCVDNDKLSEQPEQAALQIRTWVPVGTSLKDAQVIMEQHNFKCSMETNSSFEDLKVVGFLYCERSDADTAITPIVIKRWQVALVLSGGNISIVKACFGLIGP